MHLSTFDIIAQQRLLADDAPFSFRCISDVKKAPHCRGFFLSVVRHA